MEDTFDLTPYAGQNIILSFRYMTDWANNLTGFFVDNIRVTADGNTVLADGAENGDSDWTLNGFSLSEGFEMKNHYYMLD